MNKIIPVPVNVSQCEPVYKGKKLNSWKVNVEYAGDLLCNTSQINRWKEIIQKYPSLYKFKPEMYDDMMMPVFKKDLKIPNFCHLDMHVEYNDERDTSSVIYTWRDGMFGHGAKRAWNFRIKMLAQIAKQNNKKTK